MASYYEENVRETRYFRKHIQDNDIDKDALVEYGDRACICRLVEPSKERNLLRRVMFSKNFRASVLEKSRVETLGLVLCLIKQCKALGIDFTGNTFRDAVYFDQTTNGQSVSSLDLQDFQEIASRWRLFQLHEYLTYSLESLLHALLGQLKRKEEGLSLDDFLKLLSDPSSLVAETLNIPNAETIDDFVNKILNNYGLEELSQESSLKFSQNCNLTSLISEKTMFTALQESNKRNDLELIVGHSVGILLLNYIRSLYLLSSVDPVTLWFNNRAIIDWSPTFFAQEIKSRATKWSIENLVRYYFARIIERHDIIALEKQMAGNDTFRYEEKAGRLRFRMDIYPDYPTQRSSRISSVISILQQLGLIGVENKVKTLTADGEKFLGECMNERSH